MFFGKGLGAFLAVKGRLAGFGRTATAYPLWVAMSLGLVAVYCRWWAWYGGFTWGPRFFLFVSILACMALAIRLMTPASSLAGALVTLGALALTTWVAICACVGLVGQDPCRANNFAHENLCSYSPEFSVLWQPLLHWPPLTFAQQSYVTLAVVTFLRLAVPFWLAARRTVTIHRPKWIGPISRPMARPDG